MIKVNQITKRYGKVTAIENVSFEINDGEIVGLLGPNGAGKSTTMNIITGFIEPTNGEVIVNGINMQKRPQKAKKEIAYMPEGVPLYGELTAKEFVTYMAELRGLKGKNKKERVEKVLHETGLTEVQNKLTSKLSRGYKQRVSLAGTLVSDPKIIILDEPTVGLDPKQVTEIRELIRNLRKDHTVIISSHILSEISQICNKVIILKKGKVIAIDEPEKLEEKATTKSILYVTVEDTNDKMSKIKERIKGIKEIKLIKENTDNTKQYEIEEQQGIDLRKTIIRDLTKEDIIVLEMKKADTSLEDAFMKLIEGGEE